VKVRRGRREERITLESDAFLQSSLFKRAQEIALGARKRDSDGEDWIGEYNNRVREVEVVVFLHARIAGRRHP
jgi:hypothetical protein